MVLLIAVVYFFVGYTIAVNNIQMIMTKHHKVAIKPNNPIIPKVYGLPKIHKTGNKMRPIISNIGAPTSWLNG